jgi:hypothetical protein
MLEFLEYTKITTTHHLLLFLRMRVHRLLHDGL